jgi:serine/threonine-protein kinase
MNPGIELDELKSAWRALDARLASLEGLGLDLARERRAGERTLRMRASIRALWPLAFGQVVQFAIGAAIIVFAAIWWSSNLERIHLLLCGVFLHATGIWMAASAGYELALLAGLRWTMPVLDLQKRLATLRRWRVRNSVMFAWIGCFAWVPMLIMAFAAAGVDMWVHRPLVVASWLGFAFASAGLFYLATRAIRAGRLSKLAAALNANAAGQSVRRAELALADVERFEAEGR